MKKLKLSRSKVSDEKQQKISNFFAVSKEVPVSSSNPQRKISSYFTVPKQEAQNIEINGDVIAIEDTIIQDHINCNLDSEKNENKNITEVTCEISKGIVDNITSNYKRNEDIKLIQEKTNKIGKDTINLPLDCVRDDYSRTSQNIPKNSNQSSRSPCETLCTTCLKTSPGSEQNSCNNCNLSEKTNKSITFEKEIVFPGEGHFVKVCNNSVLIDGVDKSPDVIPATPPVVKKENRSRNIVEKPIKRKFNFSESSELKKKCLSQVESKIKDPTKFHSEESNSKCQISPSEEKENVKVLKIKNPFGKPNSSLEQSPCSFSSKDDKENKGKNYSCTTIQKAPESSEIKMDIKCVLDENNRKLDENCETNHNVVDSVVQQKRNENVKNDDKITSFNSIEHEGEVHSISVAKNNELIGSEGDKHFFEESSSVINNSVSTKKGIFEVNQNQPQFCEPEDISTSFFEDLSFDESNFKEPIKLDNGRRCKVIAVEQLEACGEVVLTLQPCDSISGETAVCVLRGSWTSTVVREGDVVSVTATQMSNQPGCWVVDNDAGLLTTHPDTLVSGTTIVGSLFCTRRSVLSDMYRGHGRRLFHHGHGQLPSPASAGGAEKKGFLTGRN
ncbi:repetitive organellar protein-like [Homalodisca vitripennis]|uniref:repetitive organellar protein-like n=1 Tax=Homalodisca vitripennis TaxID=197043 RepID=UPI001EEC09F6|nr:repetitive organellar protein-like [Homalodisca vitripennis]